MAITSVTLAGCLGPSLAQQVASSLMMQAADKITANALEAQQRKEEEARRNIKLQDTIPDEYWGSFITSGFESISPRIEQLPQANHPENKPQSTSSAKWKSARLVKVEMWNLLIGEEKDSVLQKARLLGATKLPPAEQWPHWQVAMGSVEGEKNQPITFLIPPEFGRMKSGQQAVVEIAESGELSIARYPAN